MQLYYLVISNCTCSLFHFINYVRFGVQAANYMDFSSAVRSFFHTDIILVRLIVWIRLQNHKIFHYRGLRQEFFSS